MRQALLGLVIFCTQLACAVGVTDEEFFVFEATEIPTWPDSAAYALVIPPDRIDLIGFYTECSYAIQGRLVLVDDAGIVIDAQIRLCPGGLCIENKHTRYRASLTDVPSGKHRIILEQVIRDCFSGALLDSTAILDTLVTIPPE
ncbi:MAG TPA: hypothetical protein VFP10_01285 [Candidatus Eisenbacteria bacterium]|nr:hypothetical protein [Candidatus Eisenbacteria bacterium]